MTSNLKNNMHIFIHIAEEKKLFFCTRQLVIVKCFHDNVCMYAFKKLLKLFYNVLMAAKECEVDAQVFLRLCVRSVL